MALHTLLDLALKSDEVVEILEHFDISVVYDFDRLRENTADCYWASSPRAGFEMRFNEHQVLDVIFMYVRPRDGFSPVDPALVGLPLHASFDQARSAMDGRGLPYRESPKRAWIKGDLGDFSAHYEFDADGGLGLVTLTASRKT